MLRQHPVPRPAGNLPCALESVVTALGTAIPEADNEFLRTVCRHMTAAVLGIEPSKVDLRPAARRGPLPGWNPQRRLLCRCGVCHRVASRARALPPSGRIPRQRDFLRRCVVRELGLLEKRPVEQRPEDPPQHTPDATPMAIPCSGRLLNRVFLLSLGKIIRLLARPDDPGDGAPLICRTGLEGDNACGLLRRAAALQQTLPGPGPDVALERLVTQARNRALGRLIRLFPLLDPGYLHQVLAQAARDLERSADLTHLVGRQWHFRSLVITAVDTVLDALAKDQRELERRARLAETGGVGAAGAGAPVPLAPLPGSRPLHIHGQSAGDFGRELRRLLGDFVERQAAAAAAGAEGGPFRAQAQWLPRPGLPGFLAGPAPGARLSIVDVALTEHRHHRLLALRPPLDLLAACRAARPPTGAGPTPGSPPPSHLCALPPPGHLIDVAPCLGGGVHCLDEAFTVASTLRFRTAEYLSQAHELLALEFPFLMGSSIGHALTSFQGDYGLAFIHLTNTVTTGSHRFAEKFMSLFNSTQRRPALEVIAGGPAPMPTGFRRLTWWGLRSLLRSAPGGPAAPRPARYFDPDLVLDVLKLHGWKAAARATAEAEAAAAGAAPVGPPAECQCCFGDFPAGEVVRCTGPSQHALCVSCVRSAAGLALDRPPGNGPLALGCFAATAEPPCASGQIRLEDVIGRCLAPDEGQRFMARALSGVLPATRACGLCGYFEEVSDPGPGPLGPDPEAQPAEFRLEYQSWRDRWRAMVGVSPPANPSAAWPPGHFERLVVYRALLGRLILLLAASMPVLLLLGLLLTNDSRSLLFWAVLLVAPVVFLLDGRITGPAPPPGAGLLAAAHHGARLGSGILLLLGFSQPLVDLTFLPARRIDVAVRQLVARDIGPAPRAGDFAGFPTRGSSGSEPFICRNIHCLAATCAGCGEPAHGGLPCRSAGTLAAQVVAAAAAAEMASASASPAAGGSVDLRHPPARPDAGSLDQLRLFVESIFSATLIRTCPRCQSPFVKEQGCNEMTCPICGTKSCYLCRQPVAAGHFCRHLLEPGQDCPACDRCRLYISEERHVLRHFHVPTSSSPLLRGLDIDFPEAGQPLVRLAVGYAAVEAFLERFPATAALLEGSGPGRELLLALLFG
ncbi:hypothetical protein H696_03785 [Fonticula alba]|uniref:RING-type domain-containing protein n=1 Tax=Fonticula alba TaxID=691883 RepID=A0A058Z5Z1_FONAL|nr:hypothetical protein H696_03785 [Fonticula alba]KCV69353.1 hypothetical protein H696_03785 [Fonticula alba]|eukprot:XP_009495918.1 hypothetical protein H696_03785 [Fonticula alba]